MLRLASVIAVAGLLAACNPAAEDGPAVATPEGPQNEAVATDTTKTETPQTAGANSFTEEQARGHIEAAGYTDVKGLTQNPQGIWEGSGMKDGAETKVSVDFKGAVTTR